MDTEKQKLTIAQSLITLKGAKKDTDIFAALFSIAKASKESSCSAEIKQQIIDAIGGKFISRLFKTKTVPAECPATAYKSVALSVLSALCKENACKSVLMENVQNFNTILLLDDEDTETHQLKDDTYECLNSLCQTTEGVDRLKNTKTVAALCEVISSDSYGHGKALDVLLCILSQYGCCLDDECRVALHSVVAHFSKQFSEDQLIMKISVLRQNSVLMTVVKVVSEIHPDPRKEFKLRGRQTLKKFELCKTLVFLLTAIPDVDKEGEPPWIPDIVTGLDSILRSRVGKSQREPALRLASMMVQSCGMYCLLPPTTTDNKLFLLITHLCCVEVRMVLEDEDLTQFQTADNGRLLSSCYSFLESVINYMTGGPSLSLDDRQVLQLHSAMVGAFSAILQFLKRVSNESSIQWNSIILATVRVLGAWLSEETSALKEEVYELIPFLIQISKMCLPPEVEVTKEESSPQNNSVEEGLTEQSSHQTKDEQRDSCSSVNGTVNSVSDKMNDMDIDGAEIVGKDTNTHYNSKVSEDHSDSKMKDRSGSDKVNQSSNDKEGTTVCDNGLDKKNQDKTETAKDNSENEKGCTQQLENSGDSKHVTFDQNSSCSPQEDPSDGGSKSDLNDREQITTKVNIAMLDNFSIGKETLSDSDLNDLHLRVDIFHFLLPALCHFTADEEPRKLLLDCGALCVLDLYTWKQWEKFIKSPNSRDIQSSLLILCNIFLNFAIVEPSCIKKYPEFAHILLLAVKGVHAMELNEEHLALWSHFITLGLMLLRQLYKKTDEFLEQESLHIFYESCVKYLNGAYKVKPAKKKGAGTLELAEEYNAQWDQISQTWFLSMQAMSALVPVIEDIPATILQTGWLPGILKSFLDVKASAVLEEVRSCYLLLFVTMARKNSKAKEIIKEKGGMEFARIYKCKELTEVLQAS